MCADEASKLPCHDRLNPVLLDLLLGTKWGGAWASLGRITLADAGLGDRGVSLLARALVAASAAAATAVRTTKNKQALTTTTGLRQIDLSGNGIGDVGCAAVVKCLLQGAHRGSIISVCLARNVIGSSGAALLANVVASCASLTSLNLACNPLTRLPEPTLPGSQKPSPLWADYSGAMSLAHAIGGNGALRALTLRHTGIEGSLAAEALEDQWAPRHRANLHL